VTSFALAERASSRARDAGQVPLSPGLAQRLWTLLATVDDDRLVFRARTGQPLDRNNLYREVRAAGERAGIEWPVGLHTFRHSCASIMFRRGVSKEAIRRLLGHHSWDFTAGTYLHLDDDDLPDGAIVGDWGSGAGQCSTCRAVLLAADPEPNALATLTLIPVDENRARVRRWRRRAIEVKWGDKRQADGTIARLFRLIDRSSNRYIERVERVDGSVTHTEQALSDHRGHGSARAASDRGNTGATRPTETGRDEPAALDAGTED